MAIPNIHIDASSQSAKASRPPLSPEEIAQRNTAKRARWVIDSVMLAAGLFAFVSFCYLAMMLFSMVDSWGGAVRALLISAGLTLICFGLPVLAGIMQQTFPAEAAMVWKWWKLGIAISAIGLVSYTLSSSGPPPRKVEEIQADLRYLPPAELAVWQASAECESPSARQAATCAIIKAKRAVLIEEWNAAEGGQSIFSPRRWLPNNGTAGQLASATGADEGAFRKLLWMLLSLGVLPLSGYLMYWAILAEAETHRLAVGQVGLNVASKAPAPAVAMIESASGDVFSQWSDYRLWEKPGGQMSGEEGYADYCEACDLSQAQPISFRKFCDELTARAERSHGRIIKVKSNGKIVYRGLCLGEQEKIFVGSTQSSTPLLR